MKEINLKVEGMMCTGCENRIQNAVKNMNGIKSVKADHTTGTVKIEAEDGIEESKIKEKIEDSKVLMQVLGSDHCPVELDIKI